MDFYEYEPAGRVRNHGDGDSDETYLTTKRYQYERSPSIDSFETLYFTDEELLYNRRSKGTSSQRHSPRWLLLVDVVYDPESRACRNSRCAVQTSLKRMTEWELSETSDSIEAVTDLRMLEMLEGIEFGVRRNRFCRDQPHCIFSSESRREVQRQQPRLSKHDNRQKRIHRAMRRIETAWRSCLMGLRSSRREILSLKGR